MRPHTRPLLALALAFLITATASCARHGNQPTGDIFYKIEAAGAQVGYAVLDTQLVVQDGEPFIRLEQRTHVETRLMGSDIDSETRLTYLLDPDGKRVRHHEGETSAGSQSAGAHWTVDIAGDQAHSSSSLKRDDMVLDLPPDVVIENTLFFDHVVADFAGTDLKEKTYPVLDMIDFAVRDTRYEKAGEETLKLAGTTYNVIVVDRSVEATGVHARMWIDTKTGMLVKIRQQDGTVVSLARPSVVNTVARGSMDSNILTKANVAIADVPGITYMKVRAKIRPIGVQATVDALNVPGQRFTGTVEDNVIDGVFEIEHPRFDGTGAPPFPVEKTPPEVAEYLGADGVYEADDSVLIAKAHELTAGATDTWDAATRLATWVADEIGYAIPGGGTARKTYDTRAGECGAHSVLLATFCRAVGIPARMVWGCMYTPNSGGTFGQHGWTEVYMGAAGWIPLDATAHETDFVDSGHIRVGPFGSLGIKLNAEEFEILDYRVAGADKASAPAARQRYAEYIGEYRYAGSRTTVEVKVMDGALAVDIPNQAILALHDPDDEGRWVCTMAKQVYVTFDRKVRDGRAEVEGLTIHEVHSLPRQGAPDAIDPDAPDELAPYVGSYHLAALNADFEVAWEKGGLVLRHPQMDRPLPLKPESGGGALKTPGGRYTVSFVTTDSGTVASMTLDAATSFMKR